MYTLTIKLKQHTPIIHFQSEYARDGAILRATEVKSKLDKFITKQLSGKIPKEWKIGETDALDYKIRIKAPLSCDVWDLEYTKQNGKKANLFPIFFGNMGNEKASKPKKLVYTDKEVELTIWSLHQDLLREIDDNIGSFFLMNNFGTRQSKGFGSFMAIGKILDTSSINKISIKAKGESLNDFKDLFDSLDLFYKTLRSGINNDPFYFRSLLFFYVCNGNEELKNYYYDKLAIRSYFGHFKPNREHDKGQKYESKISVGREPRLFRDMLGLSSSQSWMYYNAKITKTHKKKDKKSPEIVRFKSPIMLKPIKEGNVFIVYIVTNEIPKDFYNQEFVIVSSKNKEDKPWKGEITKMDKSMTMETPVSFDINDFIRYSICGKGRENALEQIKRNKKTLEAYDEDTESIRFQNKEEYDRRSKKSKNARRIVEILNEIYSVK